MQVRLPADSRVQAGKLALRYDPANVHWFDPQSGKRIDAEPPVLRRGMGWWPPFLAPASACAASPTISATWWWSCGSGA